MQSQGFPRRFEVALHRVATGAGELAASGKPSISVVELAEHLGVAARPSATSLGEIEEALLVLEQEGWLRLTDDRITPAPRLVALARERQLGWAVPFAIRSLCGRGPIATWRVALPALREELRRMGIPIERPRLDQILRKLHDRQVVRLSPALPGEEARPDDGFDVDGQRVAFVSAERPRLRRRVIR